MTSLGRSVAATLQYAQIFDFDLTFPELHSRLIASHPVTRKQLAHFLKTHPHFQGQLSPKLTPRRQKRAQISQQKLSLARRFAHFLKLIPTINLVAVTGSIAVHNAQPDDDIDILIITSSHTLWLTRPLVFLITKLFFTRRRPHHQPSTSHDFCNNLWLDTLHLTVPQNKRNLYTAHEIVQLKPLFNRRSTYQQLLAHNTWIRQYLANAYQSLNSPSPSSPSFSPTYLLAPFNLLFFLAQYLYMLPKLTQESVTLHSAYFHPRSLYPKIKSQLTSLSNQE